MLLTVNGEKREVEAGLTVSGFLDGLGIDPESAVVEKNLTILKREDHRGEILVEGDAVEIIRMVDGG